ncbi:hypothetical protein ACO1PK_01510 [Alishewanella sp. d11]|uniref:hypothetical protein n=1 Tax=Alishewanella sp. d11 TaxID=3414030 RepID=UPI003BF8E055
MEEIIKLPIQLGFDLATSLTIIGSLFFVIFRIQRSIKSERSQRFDKQARSVAATQLQLSVDILAKIFVEKVIKTSEKVKSNLVRFNANPSTESLALDLKKDGRLAEVVLNFNDSRASIKCFFEMLHSEKYKIIPVIDAIEDNIDLVATFNEQLHKVEYFHDKHITGISCLLEDIYNLTIAVGIAKNEHFKTSIDNLDAVNESAITKHVASIFFNPDYCYWVRNFVPEEDVSNLETLIKNYSSLKESPDELKSFYYTFCNTLVQSMFDDDNVKYKYFSQVIIRGLSKQDEMNKICKELLVTFSAILKYLLAKDSGSVKVSKIIELYKSESYFGLDKNLR